jgi:hypothetical protein
VSSGDRELMVVNPTFILGPTQTIWARSSLQVGNPNAQRWPWHEPGQGHLPPCSKSWLRSFELELELRLGN